MMNTNAVKRILGVMTATVLLFYSTLPVFAAGEKEEVVYVKLSHDGRVDTIYVVNRFDLPQGGTITDTGSYSEIRNLSTTDPIRYANNTVSVAAPQGTFYYEGVLEGRDIPWNISVEYLLDGRPVSGDRLAGESGHLQIDLHIHQSPDAHPVYADNYAIQASLTLDGELCANIEAENATIASVGQNKLLSYIILPGKSGDYTITADVVDFEMDGISINGIPLSLSIDDPDTEEIKDKIAELQDGAIELDDGARELDDGAQELNDGAVELDEGATKLDDGVLSLEDGLAELDDGVEELQEGADDLRDGAHELYSGTKDLRDGASDLEDGVSKLNSGAYTFGQGLSLLGGQSSALVEGSSAIGQGLRQINDGLAAVGGETLDTVAEQAQALANGSDRYLASLDAMIAEYEAQLSMLRSASRSSGSGNAAPAAEPASRNQEGDSIAQQAADGPDGEDVLPNAAGFDSGLGGASSDMAAAPTQAAVPSLGASGLSANAGMVDFLEATIENLKMMRQSYLEIHAGIEGMESFAIGMGRTLPSLSAGIGEIAGQYEVLDQAVGAYTRGVAALDSSYSALTGGISDLADGVQELMDGVKELRSGARELYDGTYDLQDGVNRLTDGAAELRDGATELRDGTIDMKDGTLELLDGVQELLDGTWELLDGTTELREKTADMDQEIDDKIDEMLEEYRRSDFDAVSFVDAGNRVSSVQFVMLTESISMDEVTEEAVEQAGPETLTLWQRFLNLFAFLWA